MICVGRLLDSNREPLGVEEKSSLSAKSSCSWSVELECAAAKGEERINVAETDVISRTESESVGLHGLIECH